MNMAEKILAATAAAPARASYVKPGDAVLVDVDAGYSHEFTTAQVDKFLSEEYGPDYKLANPTKFAVFEDHLIYATGVASMAKFADKIEKLRELQRDVRAKTGVRNYSAQGRRLARHLPPGRARAVHRSGRLRAGDRHPHLHGRRVGRAGVGRRRDRVRGPRLLGLHAVAVPESIRFELTGKLRPGVTAKDVMLHILATYAKREETLNRVMEFGGEGLFALSPDERATLANMATECSARGAVMEVDDTMLRWIAACAPGVDVDALRAQGRHARSRRAVRRRRARDRSREDPADGRAARRSRPRHRERSEERRARSPRSAR